MSMLICGSIIVCDLCEKVLLDHVYIYQVMQTFICKSLEALPIVSSCVLFRQIAASLWLELCVI